MALAQAVSSYAQSDQSWLLLDKVPISRKLQHTILSSCIWREFEFQLEVADEYQFRIQD